MHEQFLHSALAIFSLLTFATILHAGCRKINLPFPVGLLFGGFFLILAGKKFAIFSQIFAHFSFSPEIVFFVFLPTLIFESAYHLNFRQFRKIFGEVIFLATFGVFFSAVIIALPLFYFLNFPLPVALLFGVLISATDPVAVLAIFRELRAPKKLSTIADGESLINDATAVVGFQFFKKIAIASGAVFFSREIFFAETKFFFENLFEGILVGLFFGFIFSFAIRKSASRGVQITLSLILAHATFLFAEGILHVSGILATMVAGIIMGNFGRRKLEKEAQKIFSEIWEFMGFVANSLIFLLLGMKIGQINFFENWQLILISAGTTIFLARPISVFFSFLITNFFRKKEKKISLKFQIISIWGGLRGALSAAVVLMLPENFAFAAKLQAATAGTIAATFFLNATTISFFLKKLKLTEFSLAEKLQKLEAEILIDENLRKYLKNLFEKKFITKNVFEILEKNYSKNENRAEKILHELQQKIAQKNEREVEKILMRHALFIEKKSYEKLFENNEISEKLFLILLESIFRQIDRLNRDQLPHERKTSKKIAPKIPEKISRIFLFFGKFGKKIWEKFREKKILEKMQHYRARRIASWKVFLDLEKLSGRRGLFENSSILEKIIIRYKKWNLNAEIKTDVLEKNFPKLVRQKKIEIAEFSCAKMEKKIKKIFLQKGLISEKVFLALQKINFFEKK